MHKTLIDWERVTTLDERDLGYFERAFGVGPFERSNSVGPDATFVVLDRATSLLFNNDSLVPWDE